MAIRSIQSYTFEEYLALEREAEFKSEYIRGEIVAMSGGTYTHALIAANVLAGLGARLRGTECHALGSDMRLLIEREGVGTYPDAMVLCGKPEFHDSRQDVLLNPTLVLEVLSPSTEAYDRGLKFEFYRSIPTLKHVVFVAQNHMSVDVYERTDAGWVLQPALGLDAVAALQAIGVDLPLSEIYENVEFPERPARLPGE
jgi:Uma2 family endonuclease